jgi:hypothetical protein
MPPAHKGRFLLASRYRSCFQMSPFIVLHGTRGLHTWSTSTGIGTGVLALLRHWRRPWGGRGARRALMPSSARAFSRTVSPMRARPCSRWGGGVTRRIEHLASVLSSLLQQAIGSTVLYYLAFLFSDLAENIRYSLKTISKEIFFSGKMHAMEQVKLYSFRTSWE